MAATVKPIEAKAVHRIQAGQVIVDLCSVVKELVENSLDAGATVLEVRFKNNGLDEIEVQDNGSGITPANYENVALKHYTSKLSTYDDLESLSTFGFRGEALSSLCALSTFNVTTALEDEAPKGHRLDFETSGKLKSTSVVACQRGTTATVAGLFDNLPVRRKELTKNIKREYGKVLGLLHAYACISVNVKFTVKNALPKTKSTTVFATNSNQSTRDNIANIYGAKTLSALAQLNLTLTLDSSAESTIGNEHNASNTVIVKGHISKPIFGEGRQTPDRQMFFVNGRPCGLPQIAKAINEVYKSFNVSQSPFIFADFQMDTKAYDVNVSPDKRSIFLHNASALIDALRSELEEMFDQHEQTLPQSQLRTAKVPAYRQLSIQQIKSVALPTPDQEFNARHESISSSSESESFPHGAIGDSVAPTYDRLSKDSLDMSTNDGVDTFHHDKDHLESQIPHEHIFRPEANGGSADLHNTRNNAGESEHPKHIIFRNVDSQDGQTDIADAHITGAGLVGSGSAEQNWTLQDDPMQMKERLADEPEIFAVHPLPRSQEGGTVDKTYDRMRSKRMISELATITIGDKTVTRLIGSSPNKTAPDVPGKSSRQSISDRNIQEFSQRLGRFSAGQPDLTSEPPLVDGSSAGASSPEDSSESEENAKNPGETGGSIGSPVMSLRGNQSSSIGHGKSNHNSEDDDQEQDRLDEMQRVAELIKIAEKSSNTSAHGEVRRTTKALRSAPLKDLTAHLQTTVDTLISDIASQAFRHHVIQRSCYETNAEQLANDAMHEDEEGEEERLSLTVSKSDFAKMSIVGQFNLGFILAVRNREQLTSNTDLARRSRDELFIIDQHASDEKFNFERLQAETVVGNQRMVRPVTLDLTAVEEEILIDSGEVLEKNGFVVDIDLTGNRPVGQRCQLVSLPLSKEVVFNTKDLDELVHLLAESPMLSDSKMVPRPSKVRKMFAMRACRSSIMIGKTLSRQQMMRTVQHMGTIDKPWNCPHGRPTMRHLASLDALDALLWHEGDGLSFGREIGLAGTSGSVVTSPWKEYVSEQT